MTAFPASLPRARTADPRSAPTLRWGVMGTGWIAERFVGSLKAHSSQAVVAVGSRSQDTAERFARRFEIERVHPTYRGLVTDPAVDVVYVATPHNAHLEGALLALEAGKHTVVEKPLATSAHEARRIASAAAERGLFCMEAHWTTFLPKFDVIRQICDGGTLGAITAVVADFGEWFPPHHRIHRADLAGGPMLDLGTYLVNLVLTVFGGTPERIVAQGSTAPSGVMGQTGMMLTLGHQHAVLHTTLLSNTSTTATIAGTDASITIDGPFYQPGGFTLAASDGSGALRYDEPRSSHLGGLHYQAAEVARRIRDGERGSVLHPLALSIQTLAVMDEVRRQTQDRLLPEK